MLIWSRDKLWLKCLVMALLVASAVNVVFDSVYVYGALILNFGWLFVIATHEILL